MKTLQIAAALLLLSVAGSVHAQDEDVADAKAIPASVQSVQSGGYWQKGDQDGHYRVVVTSGGFEHVISKIYVQWIELDQDAREYKVLRTLDIKELNGGFASTIAATPKFTRAGPWSIALVVGRRDGKREQRTIMVDRKSTRLNSSHRT